MMKMKSAAVKKTHSVNVHICFYLSGQQSDFCLNNSYVEQFLSELEEV